MINPAVIADMIRQSRDRTPTPRKSEDTASAPMSAPMSVSLPTPRPAPLPMPGRIHETADESQRAA